MAVAAVPTVAQATVRECRIKPTLVSTDRNGRVYVSGNVISGATGSWNWVAICNSDVVEFGIPVSVCGNWYAALLSAQATGKTIFMYYNDMNNNDIADCSTFPSWAVRTIDYLGPLN